MDFLFDDNVSRKQTGVHAQACRVGSVLGYSGTRTGSTAGSAPSRWSVVSCGGVWHPGWVCSPLKRQQCCILDKAHPCTTMCECLETAAGKMEFEMLGYLARGGLDAIDDLSGFNAQALDGDLLRPAGAG